MHCIKMCIICGLNKKLNIVLNTDKLDRKSIVVKMYIGQLYSATGLAKGTL